MPLELFMQKKIVVMDASTGKVSKVEPDEFLRHLEKYGMPIGIAMEDSKLTLLRKHTKRKAKP